MKNIDVEMIMNQIRKEIVDNGYKQEELSFEDVLLRKREGLELLGEAFEADDMSSWIVKMDEVKNVSCWRPLKGNPLSVLVKKIIRKAIKFYVEPIVSEQNQYNHYTVCAMAMAFSKLKEDYEKRIKELEDEVEKLKLICEDK